MEKVYIILERNWSNEGGDKNFEENSLNISSFSDISKL